jgi:spore coat polysaccharide biosynthesis protein SpsF (cytidylyltransferase family)
VLHNIIAVLQARCSSTRFPGKVLKNLDGKPMFVYQAKRIIRSKKINKLIVATSNSSSDNSIATACNTYQLDCFRGCLDNVLSRFYFATKEYQPDYVVRLTADCPLIDASIIDRCIDKIEEGNFDYVSNCCDRTYADGMDVEIFTFEALEFAFQNARLSSEQEHVTPYIWKNQDLFSLGSIVDNEDMSSLRLTVDYEEDLQLIDHIVKYYNSVEKKHFSYQDIKQYIRNNPKIITMNNQYACNEGYKNSLEKDELVN